MNISNKPFLINFKETGNSNLGYISIAEKDTLPFEPKRIYWTYYTPKDVERGNHSHINLEQILVAVCGKIELTIETIEGNSYNFILDSPDTGVYIPRLCWRKMKYSHNAVQMCIASIEYDEKDYIRDYQAFKSYKR